jgi:hypothetical protein
MRTGDLIVTMTFNATNKVTKKGRRPSSADADFSCNLNPLGHQHINSETSPYCGNCGTVQALIVALIAQIRMMWLKLRANTS